MLADLTVGKSIFFESQPKVFVSNQTHQIQASTILFKKIQCYNKLRDKQDNFVALEAASARAMLDSAKENLSKIDFFGILEHQRDSQRLFEATFRKSFLAHFQMTRFRLQHQSPISMSPTVTQS